MAGNLPLVSVVIRNRNGREWIGRCISSVLESTYPRFEVIFVDDASTDGSVEYIMEEFDDARLKIVALRTNVGPAQASNTGISHSSGKYLAFLDSDTYVSRSWLDQPISLMENDDSTAVVQCTILSIDGSKIDSVGHFLHVLGHPIERSFLQSSIEDHVIEVFGAKQAGAVMRRETLDVVGGFDPSFFYYFEESDLCWRILLTGHRVLTAPKSIVYHHGSATIGRDLEFVVFHREKNTIASMLKNYSLGSLMKYLPPRIMVEFLSMFVLGDRRACCSVLKALLWVLSNLDIIFEKRNQIQVCIRSVTDGELLSREFVVKDIGILFRYLRSRVSLFGLA